MKRHFTARKTRQEVEQQKGENERKKEGRRMESFQQPNPISPVPGATGGGEDGRLPL